RAGPAVAGDHDLGLLAAEAAEPDDEAEHEDAEQHVRPDPPPPPGRPGLRRARRRRLDDPANLGGAVERRATVRAVVGARRLRRVARRTGAIGALVEMAVDAALLALLGEVALVRILGGAAVGAV